MKNTNIIFSSDNYKNYLERLVYLERNREFCRHNLEHFIAVARICTILCYENNIEPDRDLIYSAALLHDLGRVKEIEEGISHEIASAELALDFLKDTDFSEEEKDKIISLIKNHRNKKNEDKSLEKMFYMADKLSRNCHSCPATDKCNWSDEKKNLTIKY
jgi:uncharacterized protein